MYTYLFAYFINYLRPAYSSVLGFKRGATRALSSLFFATNGRSLAKAQSICLPSRSWAASRLSSLVLNPCSCSKCLNSDTSSHRSLAGLVRCCWFSLLSIRALMSREAISNVIKFISLYTVRKYMYWGLDVPKYKAIMPWHANRCLAKTDLIWFIEISPNWLWALLLLINGKCEI